MKVELETVINILKQETRTDVSPATRRERLSSAMDMGMVGGVKHCIDLLTKIDAECSMNVGKYLSLTRSLPDDYSRGRGINH